MEAPSTPPHSSSRYGRARTPPSPTWGPMLEDYDPYSPRRSTRSTLASNKYSTPNISRTIHNNIPPLNSTFSAKPAFTLNDVLSPPSSPMNAGALTPRKADNRKMDNSNVNDSRDPSSALRKPSSLLPTPAKTPSMTPARKHQRTSSVQDAARVLHFQPEDPNDAMPTRRESRKHNTSRAGKSQGFHLDVEDYDEQNSNGNGFQIYTESHARVPEEDESESNPFYRPRSRTIPQTRSDKPKGLPKKSAAMVAEERRMHDAAARDEGVVYNFRGRKVFRRFDDAPFNADSDEEDPANTASQRALKRAVGSAAARPMTRSHIKPRLLFPSFDSGYGASEDVDEEAETDVEMSDAPVNEQLAERAEEPAVVATPAKPKASRPMMSPPTTKRASRKHDAEDLPAATNDALPLPTPVRSCRKKKVEIDTIPIYRESTPEPAQADEDDSATAAPPTPARSTRKKKTETYLTPVIEESESPASGGRDSSPAPAFPAGPRKSRSPFDNWPRTKGAHKRDGEPLEGSSSGAAGKRTRSTTRQASA